MNGFCVIEWEKMQIFPATTKDPNYNVLTRFVIELSAFMLNS